MSDFKDDTSATYEHMIGFVADENLNRNTVDILFDDCEKEEYIPSVKKKIKDNDFPEDWQNLIVNFSCLEDYAEFMNKIGGKPVPKLKEYIFEDPKTKIDIFSLMDDIE